ncbi:hypothetical protein LTR85_000971 [Meristemomyces frigidus]|nr:hypothetical protein LTR85_000971 [Meristemomyces frigidus]
MLQTRVEGREVATGKQPFVIFLAFTSTTSTLEPEHMTMHEAFDLIEKLNKRVGDAIMPYPTREELQQEESKVADVLVLDQVASESPTELSSAEKVV